MDLTSPEMLLRLGNGDGIAKVCEAAGITRGEFDAWWREECQRRVPSALGVRSVGVDNKVRIQRDRWGIAHVHADNELDAFFGFGYATAQDRLFQLDYLRRKARGRLAEILGPEALESDVLYRTIGLSQIAEKELPTLPASVRDLLSAYVAGINALMEESRSCLPIEFDLLGYTPEPWRETDSLVIIGEFRWYLTGRFPVLAIPELVKRAVGDGSLLREFTLAEADEESIVHPGEYAPAAKAQGRPSLGLAASTSGDAGGGSNNWVLDGYRTDSGKPIVSNDPHIPYYAVSIWHEIHIHGGALNVAGVALAGMPGIMIGRNEQVAWGITNNICSQRDLYQEKTDPAHPGCFFFDGKWEPGQLRAETIQVRGQEAVKKTIRSSRNGPIVDEIVPAAIRHMGPVSVRWLGFEPCGWLTATIGMNRASNCQEFRAAGEPWMCPTFNLVFADVDGNVGFQTVGRVPVRKIAERGYRPGWDPQHQWTGVLSYEEMPGLLNPKRGYVVTANNRLAPNDFPHALAGCWNSGHRAKRIRQQIEAKKVWARDDCRRMQMDTHSGRAAFALAPLIAALQGDTDARVQQAVSLLRGWNYHIAADSPAAMIFNVFFTHWCKTVCRERLPADQANFAAAIAVGIGSRTLAKDEAGWFQRDRGEAIRETFRATLDELATKIGNDMAGWNWGRLHTLVQPHFLSKRGDLGQLLDLNGKSCGGDNVTVNSGSADANYASALGAGYRMVAELADPNAGFWATEVAGTSGHPGSPHYADQIDGWAAGELHYMPLKGNIGGVVMTLEPK
ncbi:MAG: penicillin acylase family protein [Gemmataceae bacterium]|nr:penicillin acylase family protein [Gemmataceae bacterium]